VLDIRHMRYFAAVAGALSFAKAARALHMSQPPLSKRILDFEEELGVRLFDRSRKQVTLTAAGEALLPQARAAVAAFDSAMRIARAISPAQSKRLSVALPPDTSRAARSAVAALPRLLKITQAKEHGDAIVATAQEVSDRTAAEDLKGARVFISRASFPTADPDEFYWVDLMGLAVVNRQGERLDHRIHRRKDRDAETGDREGDQHVVLRHEID